MFRQSSSKGVRDTRVRTFASSSPSFIEKDFFVLKIFMNPKAPEILAEEDVMNGSTDQTLGIPPGGENRGDPLSGERKIPDPEALTPPESKPKEEPKKEEGDNKSIKNEIPRSQQKTPWTEKEIKGFIKREHGGKRKDWKKEDANEGGPETYLKNGRICKVGTDEPLTDRVPEDAEDESFLKVAREMEKALNEDHYHTFKYVDGEGHLHVKFARLEGEDDRIIYSDYVNQKKEQSEQEGLPLDDDFDTEEVEASFDNEDGYVDEEPLVIDINAELRDQLGVDNSLDAFPNVEEIQTKSDGKEETNTINTFSIAPLFNGTSVLDKVLVQPDLAEVSLQSETE
ncbi:MAG: hypothetical protein PHV42_02490, partial [Candidatus Pacebacteria bacterium]|nr:hypothetical protein [Candidatus Paceibacterota bacterium]